MVGTPPGGSHPAARPRRLRSTGALRRLVRETELAPADLILPLFVKEGIDEPAAVEAMPGVMQHTLDSLVKAAVDAVDAGVGGLMLFGIPARKDATGSGADAADGIVQRALADLAAELGDATVLIADLCLCEYTDHGHCGVIKQRGVGAAGVDSSLVGAAGVDNDATLERYASVAVSQARAGAHVIAPSGMQDGQVAAIRLALDAAGFGTTPILAYAAKYASTFYGPFREAAESTPQFGDRRAYQMDPGNVVEALREVRLDLEQGADMVMVKPALPYLDVVSRVRESVDVPVAAYQVSGEMAMVEAAAARGWLDRESAILESLTAIRRAGADVVLTYWATEVARMLGRHGS
jgi:porphobilinogen synthase